MGVTMIEQLAAGSGTSGILLAIVGVLVVAVLLAAFVWGRRIKAREPGPPLPEQQPRLPESGPVGDVVESREPDELVPGEQRLTPHEVKGNGTASHRRR
ncbi:DUF6479 family protein [Streptomyces libani]|uniref:DUF6479 family protein n=1 Tax=Streptomyces TaxID=1883 RepID=UPI00037612CD|nr:MULTISPECIES: DUF6479 family protein [unclassified Streptomyces]WDT59475.1 DUF6479 family protein [Streptomyces sp. G7(2002)]